MNAIDALLQGKKGVVATKKTGKVSAIDQLLQKKPVKPTIQPVKTTLPTQQNYIKATLPKDLGGGSYYLQRGEPNKLITPEATKTYGSLKPKTGQERDHFIAQSLGGASDDYNLNYVPAEVNQAWAKIESKNLNAYKRGEISLPQARLNVLKEKQEWLMKQKGISQSVKDNLIYIAKDPVNPVNTARAVLKMVKSPVSLVKEYAKAIMPKTTAELETQIEAQKKSNQPMRFEVGAGMSNVEKVLPGPRISTLEAIQQGAQIEPVQAGEAPQVSPVRQAQQVVRKPDLSPEKPSAIDKLLSGVSAVGGAIRASSVAASLPISLTANAFSKEKLPARDIIEATSKMIEDEMREGGTASTAKGAQLYLASRGIGKYGGEDVNVGDIAVLSLIGLGDIIGDPVFYFGAIKPALNQLKFNLEYKKVGQVGLKAKPGVKITNPQKSIIDVGDDLKMVIDPKAKKVTLKGYAKRGVTGKPINEKAIVNVANNISEQVGVPISSKVVGNDIVLSAGKGAMANVSKTTKPIVSPEIPAKPSVEIPVKSPEPQIKPQEARGEVLPTKTTKVSAEAKPSVVEPLEQEAKKYKTAEEFIKAQGTPVYHGTSLENANKINTEGFKAGAGKGVSGQASSDFVYATGNKAVANRYVSDRIGIKNPTIVEGGFNGKTLEIQGKMADFEAFGEASKKLGVPLEIGSQGKPTMLNMPAIKKAMQEQGYGAISFSDRYANGSKAFAILPENIKTKSQLTEIWNKANKSTLPKPSIEPLIEEAKKYKSVEEYGKEIKNKFIKEQGFEPSSMDVVNEWWKAKQIQPYIGIGGSNPEFFTNRPKLSELPKKEISKYLKFTPEGKAIYYRGIDKNVKTRDIRWGDFISPDKGKASFYGKVEKYEIDPKYVYQLGDLEAVYFNPKDKLKAPKPQSITEIWNKAHKEVKPEVKLEEKPIPKELEPLAEEARKYGSAEEFVRGIKNKVDISFTKGKPSSSILENVFKALSPKEQKELFTRMPSRRVYDRWFRKTAVEDMALNPEARLVMKELPTPYLLEKGKEVPVINISGNNIPLSEAEFKYYQAIKSQLTDFYNQAVKQAPKIKVKAPEAKQPVQILGEQLEKPRRLPISPEVVQQATGGIGKEPYAPSIVSKTLAGTPSTGKSLKPIIPQDVLDNLHRAFLSDDKEGARALYKSVSEEFSLPPMSQFEKGAQKLKKVKVSPYQGQIGGLEKEFDELIGYEPMGAHWKQEYTMRQKLLDETKAAAPPEVVKEIDKIENQLADLRFARERWEKLNEGVKQAPLKSLQEQQALKRAREEEAKRLEGEIGQLEKKIEKLRTAEQKKKYAFNVNLEKLGLTPKEKKVIGTTIDTIKPELEKIKGKRLSNREVINAAKKSEILTNISTREETLAAEAATLRARQRLVELDKDIGRLLKKGDTAELRAKMKDLVEGLRVVSGSAADTGRKLQALSIKAGDESVRSTLLKEIGKVEKDTDLIVREAAKVDWNNANSITNFYRKFVKPSTMEILDEYRYNNMLSNPRTHIRNAFSNLIQTFVTRPATLIATGKPVEATQYYQGALKGLPEAVEAFKKSFTGKTPITKPDIGLISSGKLPKFFTIPTRAMEATDRFFSTLIKGGELARGATPKQAEEAAEYSLFRAGLFPEGQGKLLNAIDSLTAWTYKAPKAVRWFVPFIRTPMNFAKQWIEYSPAGLATLPGAAKKKEQLAKTLIGSAIAAIGAKFALDGNTTWSVPTDPKQKELFYASGRKPFSVKIGDTWVPMMYAGPFAMALALPAAVRYYNDESRTSLTDSQVKKLTQSVMSMAEFLSGQTFLEGINNFVKFFSGDVDYSLPGNLAFTAGQLIPQEGLVRYISTIVDPIYRKGKTFGEGLKKNIPLLSKTLEPYTTPTGEPSRREPINYILPYDVGISKTEYEPLLQQRTQKLQQNALVNQLTKEGEQLATSRTEPLAIGDKETAALLAYYGFYDLIKKEPKSSIEQKMLADKIYQKAGDVFESEEIDDATKEKIFQAIGLTPEEVTYDYFTRLADDLQMEAILEMTAGKTGDDLVKALLEMRRESEGSRKPLLTDTIIGKMVDEGVISAGVGNLLKSYEWDKEGGGLKKTAGKGGGKKSTKSAKAITIKKVTIPKLKVSGTIGRSNIPTLKIAKPPTLKTTAQKAPKLPMPTYKVPTIKIEKIPTLTVGRYR